jgi:hypothetical protein
MKKIALVMVMGALLLVVSAGIALAQSTIFCDGGKCKGTDGEDDIIGSTGATGSSPSPATTR